MPNPSEKSPLVLEAAVVIADVLATMDPRLQRLVARRRWGMIEHPTASTGQDEVAVIAKVTDLAAWEGLSEVRIGGTFGDKGEDGTFIVTARIPVTRIEQVWRQSFVKSLKAAQPLKPTLAKTVEETGARSDLLPPGHLTNGGEGVVMGIVDYGCDFVHHNFRNADGSTRLSALWHQGGPPGPNSPFGYGREYPQDQINAALQQPAPSQALGYAPPPDTPVSPLGTHGTHVADIAAGNGRGSSVPGVAPRASLIFVDVAPSDMPFSGPDVGGRSFGDSVRLLEERCNISLSKLVIAPAW